MKAVLKTNAGYGNVKLLEVPEPVCKSDEVKIKVAFAGICGTDQHIYHDTFKNYPPVIIGHELSGVVSEVGSEVRNIEPGDRVTVLPSTAVRCGTCEYCKTGFHAVCREKRSLGIGVDGGFAEFVVAREDMVYKVPDHLPLAHAALAEPLACAVQAVDELTLIHAGATVLLTGPGPIGLLCLSLLVMKGCRVIVTGTEIDGIRLEIAKQLGADLVVNISKENIDEVIHRETNGQGVDFSIDCAGTGPSISTCLKSVKILGKHIQAGIVGKEITLDFDTILYKQLEVFGSHAHSIKTWDKTIRLFEQNKLNLAPIITHIIPLSQWEKGFDICEQKTGGKVLLACSDEYESDEGGNGIE